MWAVKFTDEAGRKFKKLDKALQRRIQAALADLATRQDPVGRGKPLQYDQKGHWRLRVGSYRVIYRIDKTSVIVVVVDIGPRDSVYD